MLEAEKILENLRAVQARVAAACELAGREPSAVRLVVVSKTWPVEALRVVYDAGVRDLGESYVQEWLDKRDVLPDDVRWHMIGHLQSNKVKYLGGRAHLVHSVDRASVLAELARRADGVTDVLLQVNTSAEVTKHGTDADALDALLDRAVALGSKVSVRGLMTIPAPAARPEDNMPAFAQLVALRARCHDRLAAAGLLAQHPCDQLSMGMSDDFEAAIMAGATLVRVGSAIFGARS
jgi:pyridoxal phosphate enzyme (YggS family)